MSTLTGDFNLVLALAVRAANRILASQHQLQTPEPIYLHSFVTRIDRVGGPGTGGADPVVRGVAEVQLSPPELGLSPGSAISVQYGIRARFLADPGSLPAPEYIHGQLQLTVALDHISSSTGDLFDIPLAGADFGVSFAPDPGLPLSRSESAVVVEVLRDFLTTQVGPVNERIPSLGSGGEFSVRSASLKTMVGPHPGIALLLKLNDGIGSPASVSRDLLGAADDFAVAVDANTLIARATTALPAAGTTWAVPIGPTTYNVQLDNLAVTLTGGAVHVTVRGTARGAIGFSFVATQTVGLQVTPHDVYPHPIGLPQLEIDAGALTWLFNVFRRSIAARLAGAIAAIPFPSVLGSDQFETVLRDVRVPVTDVRFVGAADIESDGVVIHGEIDLSAPDRPVTQFTRSERDGQVELDARESWVPGGTITRFTWSRSLAGGVRLEQDDHRFIAVMPGDDSTSPPVQCCLDIEGLQMTGSGAITNVRTSHCRVESPILAHIRAADFELPWLLVPGPGDPAQAIRAHVRPWFPITATAQSRANVLIHRNAAASDLEMLAEALEADKREGGTTFAVVSLADDAVGSQLPSFPPGVPIALAENMSAASRSEPAPATHLFSFENDAVVWKSAGTLDPGALMGALAAHRLRDGYLVREQLRLAVQDGQLAPDFLMPYAGTRQIALHKLRGAPVQLMFWAQWSSPSRAELDRLIVAADKQQERSLLLAVSLGEAPKQAEPTVDRPRLNTIAVADPEAEIARLYGVGCLPTTITINPGGVVTGIQFGAAA